MTAKDTGNGAAYRVLTDVINEVKVDVATILERQQGMHGEIMEIKKVLQNPEDGLVTHQKKCQIRFVPLENGYKLFKWIGGIVGAAALLNIVTIIYDKLH